MIEKENIIFFHPFVPVIKVAIYIFSERFNLQSWRSITVPTLIIAPILDDIFVLDRIQSSSTYHVNCGKEERKLETVS